MGRKILCSFDLPPQTEGASVVNGVLTKKLVDVVPKKTVPFANYDVVHCLERGEMSKVNTVILDADSSEKELFARDLNDIIINSKID